MIKLLGEGDMEYKCLIIDDDDVIAQSTAEYFNIFDIKCAYITEYDRVLPFLNENTVSMILLDINLGEKSGFELCKKIREMYDMPILFISARTSDDDVLTALNIGGDDYIKKPYSLNILLAKARAVIGRYESTKVSGKKTTAEQGSIVIAKDTYLDTATHQIIKGSEKINLKSMEYKLLYFLLNNKNRVVTKEELFDNVWEDTYVGEGNLSVHIRHLREKIEENPNNPTIIRTIWGVGYIIDEYQFSES